MTRASGIAAAFVVALALAPISAEAQQIFACVNNSSGTIHIVAQNVPCQSNEMLLAWSAGPGGVLAGADFQCVPGTQTGARNGFLFTLSNTGVNFGSGIGTTGGQFTSFVLQPGIYQFHLSGNRFSPQLGGPVFSLTATGVVGASWFTTVSVDGAHFDIVGGDRLVSIGQPNTSVQIINDSNTLFIEGVCEFVITRLQ
jgi:hypothetical protein